jgi:Ca-activated chloride channel family protein
MADKDMRQLAEYEKKGVNYNGNGLNLDEAKRRWHAYNQANQYFRQGQGRETQLGKLGVDLSLESNNLRNQAQISQNAVRRIQKRNALEVGGVWIDEAYQTNLPTVTVKAQSKAYFRILERHSMVKDVYTLGNHLVWVTPSGTALIIDTTAGQETMTDAAIDALFVAKKK